MKKLMSSFIRSFILIVAMVFPAFAIWVPSTSLKMQNQKPVEHSVDSKVMPIQPIRPIVAKLATDEQRLADILSDLKQDQAELEKTK